MKRINETIVICASGPSLTHADCVKANSSGAKVITVNSSWEILPDCDYIFAADYRWWETNIDTLPEPPQRWSNNLKASRMYHLEYCPVRAGGTFNSGQLAIHFATWLGAKNILLLGFDCSVRDGIHWHGKHASLANPGHVQTERWKKEFRNTAGQFRGSHHIINCSARTELDCFTVMNLDDALALYT
ncbi:hypothetical protein [Pluralibacter sp.]|jgi:hypothetical protein|uniref:hypothetical protein n=1 Tax=Pluralibacter sp. TaxID=1920032 RepID=UPI0025F1ECE2|nr:hypothetical protein [Pluralibacter sp.]MBV8043292.1 hypothetical protein [Pluralibacter sp.]